MTNPLITIHNVQTGEIIEREMTAAEFAEWQAQQEEAQAQVVAKAEAEAKRQALLKKLGITEEEAKLLLS